MRRRSSICLSNSPPIIRPAQANGKSGLNGADSKKRGSKADLVHAELKQLALLTRERDKLRVQLSNAQLVIEVQKEVAALLE